MRASEVGEVPAPLVDGDLLERQGASLQPAQAAGQAPDVFDVTLGGGSTSRPLPRRDPPRDLPKPLRWARRGDRGSEYSDVRRCCGEVPGGPRAVAPPPAARSPDHGAARPDSEACTVALRQWHRGRPGEPA